jgi:hypothetical protein
MGFQEKARELVFNYRLDKFDKSDPDHNFILEDVYVVWFSKTLQNWKALVSTTLPDEIYYEITYNGDKQEAYIDVYKKWDNICVKDEE